MMSLDETIERYEEAIKENENELETLISNTDKKRCQELIDIQRQFAEWLKELKVLKENQRWIPCSERLPDNEDEMLVTYIAKGRKYVHIAFCSKDEDGSARWYGYNNDDDFQQLVKDVIAWMPLPKGYEGGQQ